MAQRYRKIDPRTWNDEKFSALTPGEKLIALYVLTAQSNRCGLFVYSHALAMDQTKVAADSYAKAFPSVMKSLGWAYEEGPRVLYVPTWWKYNPPENEKHLMGCLSDLHDLPKCCLLKDFRRNSRYLPDKLAHKFGKLVDSYGIAMPIATRYQEQEQEQEQEQKGAAPLADEVGEDGQKITADTVYRAYPKHVEPEPSRKAVVSAISAIRKRGTPTPWAWLLGRVRTYADARRKLAEQYPGAEQFVPALHRWLKKGRFDEDPDSWIKETPGFAVGRPAGANGRPAATRHEKQMSLIDAALGAEKVT